MTESVNDNEALTALRLANALLKADGKNWHDILVSSKPIGTPSPDYRTPPSKRGAGDTRRYGTRAPQGRPKDDMKWSGSEIAPMLDALSRGRHDLSTMTFIASLTDFWERRGYLTTDQYNALKSMHANAEQGGRGGFRF